MIIRRTSICLALALVACSFSWGQLPRIPDNKLYWAERDSAIIYRSGLDSVTTESIVETSAAIRAIALAGTAGKVYWSQTGASSSTGIFRSNLDGSSQEFVANGAAVSLFLDEINGKLYWSDVLSGSEISRSNLDGSDVEAFLQASEYPNILGGGSFNAFLDMVLDSQNKYIYGIYQALGAGTTKVLRYDMVDNDLILLFEVPSAFVGDFMVDIQNQKMYMGIGDSADSVLLFQMNFDGSGMIGLGYNIAAEFNKARLDSENGHLYFGTVTESRTGGNSIVRTNLDGSGLVIIAIANASVLSMDIDVRPNLTNAMPTVLNQFDQFKTAHELYDDVDMGDDGLPDIASFTLMGEALKQYDTEEAQALLEGYEVNLDIVNSEADVEQLGNFRELIAAWMLMGEETQMALLEFLASKGIVLTGEYVTASFPSMSREIDEPFSGLGDFDMDGFNNALEYANVLARGGTLEDFIAAVTDPASSGTIGGGGGGTCLIAYAFVDTPLANEFNTIRAFRDEYMLSNAPGIMASDMYYRASAFILSERSTRTNAGTLVMVLMTAIASILFTAGAVKITRRNHVPMD